MSNTQLYKIIVSCEQRDGPPRPSEHHVTERLKRNHVKLENLKKNDLNYRLALEPFPKYNINRHVHAEYLKRIEYYNPKGIRHVFPIK